MYFWWIALKDIKIYIRDRRALLLTIAMPLILIAILGAAFSNMFADEGDQTYSPFELGIVNLDDGSLGKTLEEDIFRTGLNDVLIARSLDESTMSQLIQSHELEIGIIIRPNFSTNLLSGKNGSIEIVTQTASPFKIGIIESVISQFGQMVQVNQRAGELIYQQLAKDPANAIVPIEQLMNHVSNTIASKMSQLEETTSYINEQGVHSTSKVINAFQYYAVGMGVMFLLMAVVNGVGAMIEEKEDPVINRLLLSNMRHSDYLLGKLLGLLFKCGLQMVVIILGTRYIFGVDWGASSVGVFYIAFAYVVGASGLGVLLGSFINKSKVLENAGMLVVQIMAALGGSMIPLYIYPDWLNQAAKALPNALALQSFLDLMTGASFGDVWISGLMLIGIGTLLLVLGWLKLRAERRIKYA